MTDYSVSAKYKKVKSLGEIPDIPEVVDSFACTNANHITSLIGGPKHAKEYVIFRAENLVDFTGAPQGHVEKLEASHCPKFVSLKGAPATVKTLFVNHTKLKSLEHCPNGVVHLAANHSAIESLEGMPLTVTHLDLIFTNKLRSLKGISEVARLEDLLLDFSGIQSLEGAPKHIRHLSASHSALTSIKGGPLTAERVELLGTPLESLEGLGMSVFRTCKSIHVPESIKSHALGLVMLEGVTVTGNFPGLDVMKPFIGHGQRSLLDCQHALIDAGFNDLAQL